MNVIDLLARYRDELSTNPLLVVAVSSAAIALATTPLAFAVLGRLGWFKARRGRIIQRPEFSSVVASMLLVMGIPAIFAALVIKSRSFDRNRYEFDPNRTWSVLDQGREFHSIKEADSAVKQEMERLALERKNLVNNVKKLDEAMLGLRSVADTSLAVAQRFPAVLQSLAGVRKSVGLDGPQQLFDSTALPVDLRKVNAGGVDTGASVGVARTSVPAPVITASATPSSPNRAAATVMENGLTPAQIEAGLAAVPEPQRKIAAMLPLSNLPPGWTVGKSAERYLETFNADNLYEKIDGRAESFIQYGVQGMAYTFYHPTGDPSNELQVYIFEMGDSLKALGKYGSEKPDEFKAVAIGTEGYTSAGSTFFYSGRYYTQIVSTQDDPKFSAFALVLAERVAALQRSAGTPLPTGASTPSPLVAAALTHEQPTSSASRAPASGVPGHLAETNPATTAAKPSTADVFPATMFELLPAHGRQGHPKYVARDVFGYSFLSDVFMADYKDGENAWQGFLRPYRDAQKARATFEEYIAGVRKDGAEVKRLVADGADEMVVSENIGLVDVVFCKGNTLAGANGATSALPAETFARALAKSLPAKVPAIEGDN